MNEDDLITIAHDLGPRNADVMQDLLASAGIPVMVRGARSTDGEGPELAVKSADEARARAILAEAEPAAAPDSAPFVCERCGETAPAGSLVCPVCAESETTAKMTAPRRPPPIGLLVGGVVAAVLLYLSITNTP